MAAAFGRLFVPITCTGRMDCRATAATLRALIESGAWTSFEGIDALMPEVLSQLAQQVYAIREVWPTLLPLYPPSTILHSDVTRRKLIICRG
jgi:hypothetical protein